MCRCTEAEAYYLRCVEVDDKCVDAMFNWVGLSRSLPGGVREVTWTVLAVIMDRAVFCFLPYVLLGLSLPGGDRLVTWTVLAHWASSIEHVV